MSDFKETSPEQSSTLSDNDGERCIHCHAPLIWSCGLDRSFTRPLLRVVIECRVCNHNIGRWYDLDVLSLDVRRPPRQTIEDYAIGISTGVYQTYRQIWAQMEEEEQEGQIEAHP